MINYYSDRIPAFTAHQLILIIVSGIILGAAIVFISPWLTLAMMILFILFFLILKMPELGILGIILLTSTLLSSESNLGIYVGIGHIYLTDILLLTLLASIGIRGLAEPDFKLIHTPLDISLLAFVCIAFISTISAILYSSLTLQQSLGEVRNIANYLTFFAITNLLRTKKQVNILTGGLVVFASLVAIAMIIQYALGASTPLFPGRVEVLSTEGVNFSDVTRIIPPGYSLVFIMFIFLSVIQCCDEFNIQHLWLVVPWLLTGMGVVLTFKRHFWAAAIVIFFLLLYLSKKSELKRIAGWAVSISITLAIALFAGITMIGQPAKDLLDSSIIRLASLTNPGTYLDTNSSLRWRDFEYKYAIPQIIDHPVLGLGLGAQYRPFVSHRDHAEYDGRGFIHNGHIWVMVKTGLLGYLAILCVMISFVYRGLRYWKTLSTTGAMAAVLGFTLAYIGMLIGSIVEPMIIEWRWTALLAVLMGLNEVIIRLYGTPEKPIQLKAA